MCAGNEFVVYVTENARQVTMIISTPPPPDSAAGVPLNRPEPILVISRAMNLGADVYGLGFDPNTGILTEKTKVA